MQTYHGRCHCGALGYELHTSLAPSSWPVRACQCTFCRTHGARTTSDPGSTVRFVIADATQLHRYRFASKSADFYVCRNCGVYVASVVESPRGRFATLNLNVIVPPVEVPPAVPVHYDAETPAQKLARREQKWTPVVDLA
ncbi:MAG TPA: hypothetical protein VFV71_06540 [Burkholderiales bacterium]|nr:hypothetical protein [Burkholderiales bacterium]